MQRMLFVLILGMPGAAWAGLPMQQDAPAPSTAPSHHPRLFEVKFVLRPAPKQGDGLPRIRFDNQAPAIVPVPRDRPIADSAGPASGRTWKSARAGPARPSSSAKRRAAIG